ncbi:hypothetical protein RR46_05990 [Papilio xuthus]|uniref:Uncharacterized protein n=1 Tax=Papilio xuthus TaxID=66420 RepID=A0A194Q8H1_PAPXU|nr:hypothetical protein RR46_05990 [Papilio xuthus]
MCPDFRVDLPLTFTFVLGPGDLVSSLTSTFDQKLRTLNNSSPLDDGSIPYADDECQDDAEGEDKSSGSSPSLGRERASPAPSPAASPAARAHELKAAWLARDLRHSSSSSNEDEARHWPRRDRSEKPLDNDDSEKENCLGPRRPLDDDKDVDTRSQASSADTAPDNDKRLPYYAPIRLANPETVKRNSAALAPEGEPAAAAGGDDDCAKLKRSESLSREQERGEARVLRSESLNCRADRLQRSDSLGKADRPSKLEKCEWNVARRREAGAWRSTKLKRKNGMPERGIKRRHTVGGTKDFDKDGWGARHTRTSSPDLSAPAPWPAALVPPPRPPLESHV